MERFGKSEMIDYLCFMGGNIKKIEATSQDILELARLHLNEKVPLKQVAERFGRSLLWCTKALQEVGLYVGADGSDEERDRKWNHGNPLIKVQEPFFKEGVEYIAVCKATGKEFNDFRNASGTLTAHLRELRVPMADQSDFKKKKFQTEQGRPWFVDHFEFVIPKPKEARVYQYQPRVEITKEQFEAIKKGYLKDGLFMRELEQVVNMSSSLINRVLLEWNMFVPFPPVENWPSRQERLDEHRRLKLEKAKENIRFDKKGTSSFFEDGKSYVAICKQTGEQFHDYLNASGIITRHLEKIMPDLQHETNTKKREFFKTTGKPWYHEHFHFNEAEVVEQEKRKCAYCDWTTNDLTNSSGWYTTHIRDAHNKEVQEHLVEHPEESSLFQTEVQRIQRRELIENDVNYSIECKICGERMFKITDTHVMSKHGISLAEYKEKYLLNNTLSKASFDKFKEVYDKGLKLHEPTFTSKGQKEVADYITSLGFEVLMNHKKTLAGIELDVFVPSKGFAVEYNGLYHHSEIGGKKAKNFHLSKTLACEENNIRLIHIFEDDWQRKSVILKSKIAHILGVASTNKINARDCEVKIITITEANVFLASNHIQGEIVGNGLCYGAFHNDGLIAVMTLNNKRGMTVVDQSNDIGTYELTRFATRLDLRCTGLGSKILSYFISTENPKKIISFADRCFTSSNSNMYKSMGFELENTLAPDYKYVNGKVKRNVRLHKFQFGKPSIAKKFPDIYHPDKTEWQMMQEAGFDRIWDCGKFRYIWTPEIK